MRRPPPRPRASWRRWWPAAPADFHFVSTLSVVGRAPETGIRLFTEYDVPPDRPDDNYYIRTKQEAEQGYDALHLLARAIGTTGSANSDLAQAIRHMPAWEGVGGRYRFDGNGELEGKLPVLRSFRDGKAVRLDMTPAP